MRFKLLIIAILFAAMPILGTAASQNQPTPATPIFLADEETPIDCTPGDEGTWDCKENIPHSAPLPRIDII